MFKRHISKRTIATVATVLVAAITTQWLLIPQIQWNSRVSAADAWDPNNLDTVSHVNYSSVLGRGVDYGIIANHIIQTSHMETTFATNLFTSDNSRSCDVDFQDPNVIAHFMIGGFDSNTVDGGNGPSSLALDKTTASTLVFQAPEHIFTDSQSDRSEGRSFNQAYPRGGYNGPYFDLRGNFHSSIISDPDDSVGTEINNLIDRVSGVGGQSETLVSHTGYAALPYTYTDENNVVHNYIVLDDANKTVTININEECFDDKVVYIDVDKTMLEYMTAGDTHLTINKRPSTVVVFNITDEVVNEAISDGTLQLQQYRVNCTYNGTYYSMKTETPCMGDREGAPGGANAAIMDELLCQRFIWNITTNNDVTLGPFAGAILLPNSKNIDFADPPCGWIVTGENGTVNVNKEFHYLYNSSSGNIFGQMNFSTEKRFTQTYADKDSVIEESFSFNDGDFQFIWQEYNNIDFADSHKVGSAVSVDAIDQGFTQFAPLQFYSDPAFSSEAHYVPQGEFRDFYYKISENPNKIVSGVSNSDGYVLIRLRVFNDEGNLKFYVQSDAYTGEGANLIPYHQNGSFGSDVWNPNDPSNANYWIQVRGNYNFSLGGFYNRLESNVLTITKTISIPDGFNLSSVGSIEFTIDPAINGVSSVELNPSSPSAGWLVSGNTFTYKFDNVPNGSYRITESAGSCSDGLVLDTSSSNITEKTPTVDDNNNGNAIFVNSYRDSSYGSISLGKIVDGLGTDSLRPDQSFEFWVYYLDSNGNKVYLTYNNGVTSTSPGSWDQIIYIKPGQTITLTGSAVPADKVFYIEEISSAALINNGQQIDPWRFVNQGTHTCTSTSIAQTDSSGSTSVTGRSTSVDLSTTGTASCVFTNIYDGGSTPTDTVTPTPTTPTPTDTVTPTPTDSVTPTPTGTDETTPVPTSSEETTPTETTPTESDSQETQPAGPATGAIIISKTISGAPLNELETITFVITDTACGATREVPALTMENVANGLWGDAGNGTYYCIIDGLSAGVTYTIVESLDGHTSTYSLDAASSVTSASVAVVANDTVGVTLTDAYTTGGTTESSETVPTESSTDATESSNATEGTTETAPDVESVTLSGAVINSNYYTVNSDGTITLTDAGRRALGSGSFTFTITYVNGATRTQTIIIDSADRVPTTGEGSINSIAAIILLTSAAFVFAAKKLREEEQ